MAGRLGSIVRKAAITATLLAGVVVMFAAIFAATGEAPAALILRLPGTAPSDMPEDVSVLRWDRYSAVVTGSRDGYVRRLYGHGAILVLPFRKNGCLTLQEEPAA